MEKPFDTQALIEKMKSKGLDIAEEAAKIAVVSLIEWIEESVVLSPTKFDDIAVPVLEALKPIVMEQVDKIDGQVG